MSRTGDTLETVDLLYRAAMEPELWPDALDRFSRSVGCIGMAMIPITPNKTTGLVVSPTMREVESAYMQDWWRHDSRVGRIFALQLSRGVFCEAELFQEDEIRRDPFRQDFCRSWGIGAFAVQLVEPWPGHVVAFSGQRGLKLGHFDAEDIDTMRWLGRHAARALVISLRLSEQDALVRGLLHILEKFDGGVFALNARREVTLMNAAAERLLGDGITVAGRRLYASMAERQQALDLLISSAFGSLRSGVELGPLALPRPNGKRPLLIQAMPFRARDRGARPEETDLGADGALVLVVDPEQAGRACEEGLRQLGLTAAEARVAALVGSGVRRREAADAIGISEWTARDALKLVYAKLAINSQAELVRIVDRIGAAER